MGEYHIPFDDAFLVEMLGRHRRTKSRRMIAVKGFLGCFLVVAAISSLMQGWLGMAAFWAFLVVAMLYSHRIDYWLARRRFLRSPLCGGIVTLTVGPEGVHTVSNFHDSRVAWTAYTSAYMFSDGMLLYQGPGVFQWLPDRLLMSGTRAGAESIVRTRINDVRGILPGGSVS
jgi:hypothetical protein